MSRNGGIFQIQTTGAMTTIAIPNPIMQTRANIVTAPHVSLFVLSDTRAPTGRVTQPFAFDPLPCRLFLCAMLNERAAWDAHRRATPEDIPLPTASA